MLALLILAIWIGISFKIFRHFQQKFPPDISKLVYITVFMITFTILGAIIFLALAVISAIASVDVAQGAKTLSNFLL